MRGSVLLSGFIIIIVIFGFVLGAAADTNTSADSAAIESNGTDGYNSGIINLQTGWNLVGIPRRLSEDNNKASVFGAIDSLGRSIWTYNPADGGWKDLSADDILSPLEGYFVYSSKPDTVMLMYTNDPLQVPPVKDLEAGWNLVGFSGAMEASARDSLLSIRKTWTQVIGWNPDDQKMDTAIINGGNDTHADTRLLIPMRAYWVFIETPSTLASIGA